MKACKDCKWCKSIGRFGMVGRDHVCTNPGIVNYRANYYTGENMPIGVDIRDARHPKGGCMPEAKFFEPRQSWWQRAIHSFLLGLT